MRKANMFKEQIDLQLVQISIFLDHMNLRYLKSILQSRSSLLPLYCTGKARCKFLYVILNISQFPYSHRRHFTCIRLDSFSIVSCLNGSSVAWWHLRVRLLHLNVEKEAFYGYKIIFMLMTQIFSNPKTWLLSLSFQNLPQWQWRLFSVTSGNYY